MILKGFKIKSGHSLAWISTGAGEKVPLQVGACELRQLEPGSSSVQAKRANGCSRRFEKPFAVCEQLLGLEFLLPSCFLSLSLQALYLPSSFPQVGDGHPLRLWKVSTEVEAPPQMVLHRVLRERHLWDEDLLQGKVIEALDKDTEVYHYVTDSMAPHPRRDFVVLR